MSIKVTIDNVKKIKTAIENMEKSEVLVGIPSKTNKRKHDKKTNAEIGYINEFGSSLQNIPARPFLAPGVKKASEKVISVLKKTSEQAILKKGNVKVGLDRAGIIAQSSVKDTIRKGEGFKPISQMTLRARKAKGILGEKPLIETSQLINSITYVIRDK